MAVDDRSVTRDEYIHVVRDLIRDGEVIERAPSLTRLRPWIATSDALLAAAWGAMDRYHLAWLGVGRPSTAVRGRAMTSTEEAAYVREVAAAKLAVLRLSLSAVEEGMPFVGETRPIA
jgi:hypothetical protein